jgi:deoxycytidine triphosphate deaminase
MSVVPLTRNQNVVTSQELFAKKGGVEGSSLLILHCDDRQLDGSGTNVCYDLRVGARYRDHREEHSCDLADDDMIAMLPGSAVIIQTEEEFHFPRQMFGYVVPKVLMLQQGISNTTSKVDPGYHGPLLVTVFNLGKQKVMLARRSCICTLVVHSVGPEARLYPGSAKQITGKAKTGWRFRFRQFSDKLDQHHTLILAILCIVGIFEIFARLWPLFAEIAKWVSRHL